MLERRGVILYMVLVSILVAVIIASSILNIILSQSRFTYHETSRVQAYYAAMAGLNYAFDNIRSGTNPSCWYVPSSSSYTHYIYKTGATGCDINDTLPSSILQVAVTVSPGTGPGNTLPSATLSAKATYTYIAP